MVEFSKKDIWEFLNKDIGCLCMGILDKKIRVSRHLDEIEAIISLRKGKCTDDEIKELIDGECTKYAKMTECGKKK